MPDSKEVYSARIRAGRRTYFFDVKEQKEGERFLKISESRQAGNKFEHSRIVIDKEDALAFMNALADAIKRLDTPARKDPPAQKPATEKAYSVEEKRQAHPQAYARWSEEDDAQLEQLFAEGKSNKELAKVFGRDPGAVGSRIKKLELKEKYGR